MPSVKSIDLADVFAKKLREAGYTDARVRRLADIKKGGIAVRRMPSTTTARYFTGERSIQYVIQVVVARESEVAAIDECSAIASMADGLNLRSDNGSYDFTSAEVYTEPQELESGAVSVWETRIMAIITVRS